MYCGALLLLLVGAVTCGVPHRDESQDTSAEVPSDAATNVLEKNVVYASGSIPTQCLPVEYYVADKNKDLWRKDKGSDAAVKVTSNVALEFTAWDDALWYTDVNGKAFRLHFNGAATEVPAPAGVKFYYLAPLSYAETFATTTDGDSYHYVANKWIKLEKASGPKTSVSVGTDGVVLGADRKSGKLFIFNFETQKWDSYETQGVSADVCDVDHVVVIKDAANNVVKKVDGKWVPVPEKCRRVSVFDQSGFYCTTPDGSAKLVKY